MIPNLPVSPKLLIWTGAFLAAVLLLAVVGKVPLRYNLRNLKVRWLTTLLTALAFLLVVGLLTFMLAFVNGMDRLTEGSGQPGNVMVLSDGATDELFSNLARNDTSNIEREVATEDEGGKPLKKPVATEQRDFDGQKRHLVSKETYLVVNQPIPVAEGEPERRRFVQIRGVEDPVVAGAVHGLQLGAGGAWFSEAGVQAAPGTKGDVDSEQAIQAVLGMGIARELGNDQKKPHLQVNDVFALGDRKWVVVGLLESSGTTFDSEIWAKQQIVGPMFRKESYTAIVLRTQDAASAKVLAYHLANKFKAAALQAQPEKEYYAKLTETNKQFLVAIIFVAVIMAIGGVFGIMNTMFAAISQRIKDVAVLRIVGYARWQVLVSFLLESVVIALLGGALGCALGYLFDGVSATSTVSSGPGGSPKSVALKLVVDANTLLAGMLFSLVMGFVGGLLPSLAAMRTRPLESLR